MTGLVAAETAWASSRASFVDGVGSYQRMDAVPRAGFGVDKLLNDALHASMNAKCEVLGRDVDVDVEIGLSRFLILHLSYYGVTSGWFNRIVISRSVARENGA